MLKELRKYFETTPIDQLVEEWSSLEGYSKNSPSMDELVEYWGVPYDCLKYQVAHFVDPEELKNTTDIDSQFRESFFLFYI